MSDLRALTSSIPYDTLRATYYGAKLTPEGFSLVYDPPTPEPPGLTRAEVDRIAKAVVDEIDRRKILDEYARLTHGRR